MSALDALKNEGWDRLFPTDCIRITVGMATCGQASGAQQVFDALEALVQQHNIPAKVYPVGCAGACWAEPIVEIQVPGKARRVYRNVEPDGVLPIVKHALSGTGTNAKCLGLVHTQWLEGWGTAIELGNEPGEPLSQHPFFATQVKRLSASWGVCVPTSIAEYVATGGYSALEKALSSMTPEDIISEVELSGLRGRGGAGFPTGRKWHLARENAVNDPHAIVIANADEGDPGAYMDRGLMESDPHRLIEGMIIAAYAVGASRGVVFTRSEYPLAIETIGKAVKEAREANLLGQNILGSGFSFDISLVRSAGAYLCGEETAMIAALEGRRPDASRKPPFPVERGVYGHPTCVNNVETLANIPTIVLRGHDSFREVGTQNSPGTKLFCISGSVKRAGLVEVPFGTTVRHLVDKVALLDDTTLRCEAIPLERKRNAVQIGGPSGSIVPLEDSELVLDFDDLKAHGSIVGSGGIVVLGPHTCVVDTARYFVEFSHRESCGQCRSCRVDLGECADLLNALCKGLGTRDMIERLRDLCDSIPRGSKCALGKNSIAPLLSTLRNFPEVYDQHIAGYCPDLVCSDLIHFKVIEDQCPGCQCCLSSCPASAIKGQFGKPFHIDQQKCLKCWMCVSQCPYPALKVFPTAAEDPAQTDSASHKDAQGAAIGKSCAHAAPDPVDSHQRADAEPFAACLMCGACVKACKREGADALCFMGTGPERHLVKPLYHGTSPCTNCGACERVCPNGSISLVKLVEMGEA